MNKKGKNFNRTNKVLSGVILSSILSLSLFLVGCESKTHKDEEEPIIVENQKTTTATALKQNEKNNNNLVVSEQMVKNNKVKDDNKTVAPDNEKSFNSKDISYEVGFENATVKKVVDGDTLHVIDKNNNVLKLRLLLIDTPETVHPSKPIEPFGPEASAYAKTFFPIGSEVQLEYDVSGNSLDKYGRTLAYIWKDGKLYNEEIVKMGLARVAYIYAPNTRHVDLLREVEQEAKDKGLGLW